MGVSAALIITEESVGRHRWRVTYFLLGRPWRLHAVSFRVAASLMEWIETGDPKSRNSNARYPSNPCCASSLACFITQQSVNRGWGNAIRAARPVQIVQIKLYLLTTGVTLGQLQNLNCQEHGLRKSYRLQVWLVSDMRKVKYVNHISSY